MIALGMGTRVTDDPGLLKHYAQSSLLSALITPFPAAVARNAWLVSQEGVVASLMDPKAELRRIIDLNAHVHPIEAEQRFERLIKECSVTDLRALDAGLAAALDSFTKKRRRHLEELLAARLEPPPPHEVPERHVPPPVTSPSKPTPGVTPAVLAIRASADTGYRLKRQAAPATTGRPPTVTRYSTQVTYNYEKFRETLVRLGNDHVFQWTAYRNALSEYFNVFHDYLCGSEKPVELLRHIKAALNDHSREVFKKVFELYTARTTSDANDAIIRTLAGLQRFLDLVLEFYSAKLGEAQRERESAMLRQLCSAMVFGILNGFGKTQFHCPGSRVLPDFPQYWAYTLPFLTHRDLSELVKTLDPGDFATGIQITVLPLVDALDAFLNSDPELAPLPALSQYDSTLGRLDVSLQTPAETNNDALYEIQCYTQAEYVHLDLLEKAAARAVRAVVAPLPDELRGLLADIDRFSDLVVHADATAFARLREVLADIGYQSKPSSPDRPVKFNWAAVFPLENQAKIRYKHVYRSSVYSLMNNFDRRTGVRLWCSVRRSGKTTACATDLESTRSGSPIIPQTCESTGLIIGGGVFYRRVQDALQSGARLNENFVKWTVAECQPAPSAKGTRVILIIDEYETLFGDLKTSVKRHEHLRYTVVQPLLNQLVSFSHENLLILMGQQPNAHFILMDQNQLSPVVEQDSFPLFTHDSARGANDEFYELLSLALSGHIELDMDFVTRVYEETSGHPFLTIKLLISFMDWLIAEKKPISCLAPVRPELFAEFTRSNLDPITILNNSNYEFFKGAAAEHLSPAGRQSDPWLHAVYSALRAIVLFSPDSLELSLDDYTTVLAPDCTGTSPRELLSTAARANFLTLRDGMVRPRIPLLARIASAVTPI